MGRVFEFTGEGVSTLSVTDRGTICNMITELGATAAVFPSDEQTREWLAAQRREEDYVPLAADADAAYDESEVIELPRARAADREALLSWQRRAGPRGRRHGDGAGVRRLLGELLLRRPRHRWRPSSGRT